MAVDQKSKPAAQPSQTNRPGGVPLVAKKPAPSNLHAEQTSKPQSLRATANKGQIGHGNKNIKNRAEKEYKEIQAKLLADTSNRASKQLYEMYRRFGINDPAFLASINTALVRELTRTSRESKEAPEFTRKAEALIAVLHDRVRTRGNEEFRKRDEKEKRLHENKQDQEKANEETTAESTVVGVAGAAAAAHHVTTAGQHGDDLADDQPHRKGGVRLHEASSSSHAKSSHGVIQRHSFHRPRWLPKRRTGHSTTAGLVSHQSKHRFFSSGGSHHEEKPSLFSRSIFTLKTVFPHTTEDGETYEQEEEYNDRGSAIRGNTRSNEAEEHGFDDDDDYETNEASSNQNTSDSNQQSRRPQRKRPQQKSQQKSGKTESPRIQRGGLGTPEAPKPAIQRGGLGGGRARLGKNAASGARKAAAKGGKAGGKIMMQLAGNAAKVAVRNPYVAAAILIVILIILFIILLVMLFQVLIEPEPERPVENKVTITKTGPTQATLGQDLVYQINVIYPGNAQDIIVTDRIPTGTQYVSSTPEGVYDPVANTVTWNVESLRSTGRILIVPLNLTYTLTLKAITDNVKIINVASVNVIGGTLAGAGGAPVNGDVPPSQDTCGGRYRLTSPKANFGDPVCDFDKQKMGAQLQQLDPAEAQHWDSIVECESAYNPNAWNAPDDASQASLDASGAWGLFQMGSGKNGELDHGDVHWSKQISNAIGYNNKIGRSFRYWACR